MNTQVQTTIGMDKKLARMISDTVRIYEQSYDRAAADEAERQANAQREAQPDNIYAGIVDYKSFYRKTMAQAAQEAAEAAGEPNMAHPLYLLCYCTWNDIQGWASPLLK